jgi:hypothetical protein
MEHSFSREASAAMLGAEDRAALLLVARSSISYGLARYERMEVDAKRFSEALQARRAVFVTLSLHGQLRGCIGGLEPIETLVQDTARHAFGAAFKDPRFEPVSAVEFAGVGVHLSVLSEPEALFFESEADVLGQLRPGVDGLILQLDEQRGTFLPSVWEALPQPRRFLEHLKVKAGLGPGDWSEGLRFWRYTAEVVE